MNFVPSGGVISLPSLSLKIGLAGSESLATTPSTGLYSINTAIKESNAKALSKLFVF